MQGFYSPMKQNYLKYLKCIEKAIMNYKQLKILKEMLVPCSQMQFQNSPEEDH
jgi:hypothetical protein